MQLALEYCEHHPDDCHLTAEQQLQAAEFANLHSRLNYGLLVASVDYRLNPLQLIQKNDSSLNELPTKANDLDPHLVSLLTSGGTPFLRAAASNETHFQGDLVAGIRHWHAYAVSVAAGTESVEDGAHASSETDLRGNLFSALLINSIADHFLQDFFAPGHIITPRFGLHDAVALSIHNKYNTIGALFEIDSEKFRDDLAPLLVHLKEQSTARPECFMQAAGHVGEGKRISLWGDGQLARSPEQELFMILVEARSILDILQSSSGRPVNRFLALEWHPMTRTKPTRKSTYAFPTASLPFGKYVHHKTDGKAPAAGSVLAFSMGAEMLMGTEGEQPGQDKRTTARITYALECLVFGHLPTDADRYVTDREEAVPVHFSEHRQYGLNLGYVYTHNATEAGHGPLVRMIWALPLLHSQLGVDVSEKSYTYKDERAWRTSYGARVQTGFSLLLFDLGVAREWTYGTRGVLKPELAIRFGGTLTAPLSSVPVLGSIESSIFRRRRPDLSDIRSGEAPVSSETNHH